MYMYMYASQLSVHVQIQLMRCSHHLGSAPVNWAQVLAHWGHQKLRSLMSNEAMKDIICTDFYQHVTHFPIR